jgi:hypothetical protein
LDKPDVWWRFVFDLAPFEKILEPFGKRRQKEEI